jgi:thiol-disulfide isomerase/thioredoxin
VSDSRRALRRLPLLLSICAIGCVSVSLGQAPLSLKDSPDAAALLQSVLRHEDGDDRPVFLMFSASWCGLCHKLVRFLNDDQVKPIFEHRFRFVELDVDETAEHRSLVKPGAQKLRDVLIGLAGGLPFYAVVDTTGKPVANSLTGSRDNVGYPGSSKEVEHFLQVFGSAGPVLTKDERKLLTRKLAQYH